MLVLTSHQGFPIDSLTYPFCLKGLNSVSINSLPGISCGFIFSTRAHAEFVPKIQIGISFKLFSEMRGIVKCKRFDDVFWIHNDSRESARLFALDGTGRDL